MRPLSTTPKVLRCALMLLIIPAMQLYGLTSSALCDDTVPIKKPGIEMTPDIPIQDESDASSDEAKPNWLKRNKWWVAIGGILLGGVAVAAVTGGNGGGGGNNDNGSSYKLDW
jgi:hypothetical protein